MEVDCSNGKAPSPRWRHTATTIDDNRMLVWGGIGEKSRFDDTYILQLEDETWSWSEQKPEGTLPAPRSYHTATLIGNRVYMFGGYGGHGQRRQHFDDVHVLDLDLNAWLGQGQGFEVNREGGLKTEGAPPAPRGNHTTSLIEKTFLCVMGGRDSTQYFSDTCMLDTKTMTWSQIRAHPNPGAPTRICSHLAAGIQSVPSSFLFVYGGQTNKDKSRSDWSYRDKVDVLDCRSMTWLAAPRLVLGNAPPPREDGAWAFDQKTAKLIMFGGWSNDWLDDCYMLDVSGIVGPPYAVQRLEPDEGPMTGRSKLVIHGLDFVKGKIIVKFTDGRNEEFSEKADFVSSTEIHCTSPDWGKYSPGEVDVRVSIGGEGFTVNKIKWTYYTNTKPQRCVAYGPGLFDKGSVWGFPAEFKIQAKDTGGRNRNSGGESEFWRISAKDPGGNDLHVKMTDNKDGTYDVAYIPRGAGVCTVSVAYDDPVQNIVIPIRGSPWKVSFDNPWQKVKKVDGEAPNLSPGLAVTSLQKKLVFYGGGPGVHVLDTENMKWESPDVEGNAPENRVNHGFMALDNEKMLITGGRKPIPEDTEEEEAAKLPPADFGGVHVLMCEKGNWKWAPSPDVQGDKPAIIARHSTCLIPVGKKVVCFGGLNAHGKRNDDLRVLSAQNMMRMEWTEILRKPPAEAEPARTKAPAVGSAPEPTRDAPAKEGEQAQEGGEGDKHKAEGEEEGDAPEKPPPPLTGPAQRLGSGTVYLDGKVYVFGGDATHDDSQNLFTNVLTVGQLEGNLKTFERGSVEVEWQNVKVSGDIPPPRSDFVMTTHLDGKIVIYGGFDKDGNPLDDMYMFDADKQEWTCMYASDSSTMPVRPISAFVQKRLFSVAASRSKYDDVRMLDFGKIMEQNTFAPRMAQRVVDELDKLQKWAEASMKDLKIDPNSGADEDKQRDLLLRVNGRIYEFKEMQDEYDLQLDVLKDAMGLLSKHGVNMDKVNAQMMDVDENWAAVKKQAPIAKELGRNVQEREAAKVKDNIRAYENTVKTYEYEFKQKPMFSRGTGVEAGYADVVKAHNELMANERKWEELAGFAKIFEFPELMEPTKETLTRLHKEGNAMLQMWHFVDMITLSINEWKKTLWNDINCEEIEDGAKALYKQLRGLDKFVKNSNTYTVTEQDVKNFMSTIPLVADLRHPSMRDRHWKMLMDLTGCKFVIDENFKLENLLALQLHNFEDDVGEIVNRAQKEEKMEQALKKIASTWFNVDFVFSQHKDTDVQLIKLSEEDFECLEDHQLQVQNMMGSRYLATFETEVTTWQKTLSGIADVVSIMNEIQRTWAYLETLFIGSEEVKKELPEDTERFAGIDADVQTVLKDFFQTKNAAKACNVEGVFKLLEETQHKLELCEKSLANYLEQKRRIFPRFYFVSTSDLLDILSNGNAPDKVNFHMPKIIAAVDHLILQPGATSQDRPTAAGLESCVGVEHIDLEPSLKIEGRVEYYLQDIQDRLIDSLRKIMYKQLQAFQVKTSVSEWLKATPNQIILTVSLLDFTIEMGQVFDKIGAEPDAMDNFAQKKIDGLSLLIDLVRTDLSKADRMKVMCLITLDAHSRDITLKLVKFKVTDFNHFEWQSQLRFQWREDEKGGDCHIMIVDAEFIYGYEYIGNGARLVITPLTDRIYVTATQALKLCMGCAPAGPAGTGKTETTKDLGAMLAKCIYVFNCAPEMDYKSMGDIWKGLGASGAWGCFDEFNRLIAEVLSVCSTQYKAVLDAIVAHRKTFVLEGAELKLDPTCGAYITMNPGYLGRTPLPESLKALFRPVTVVVPDFAMICENMLMAEGFTQAKLLGVKFINLYTLCKDLLSKAMHYDWGLRAIKSVLRVAGDFKRNEPDKSELTLLFRSLRDFNLPKIVGDDLIIFMGLLGDLFPGENVPRQRDWDLEKKIVECFVECNYQPEDNAVLSTVQLSELLAVRHCDFIMGTSGTAKSTCWKILAEANGKRGLKTTVKDLDPKAILTTDFYGYINLATREWKDGIFSLLLRECANAPGTDPKWIILDGDLDANWIESMNSVMDDNKLLTLPSNERIVMKPHMRLIFELRDLKYATPATSSRAGVLYITETKQWWNMVQTWVMKREDDSPERKALLLELFQTYVPDTLFAIKKEFRHMLPEFNCMEYNMIQSLTRVLDSLLITENIPKNMQNEAVVIESYFVFAAIWAFGSGFTVTDGIDMRKNFSSWWKSKWTRVKMPTKGQIYDFFVDKGTYKFNPWVQIVPSISYDSSTPMDSVTVPTGETQSITFFLDAFVELRYPALLIGLAGAGKTAMIMGKLRSLSDDTFMSLVMNFNYYTDGSGFRSMLEGPLEKKAGRNYGPPGSRRLVYFVDDLNMPQLDPYETQYAISLLRQYMDYQHWYDMAKLQLRVIQNVQFLSAMNPTCGSFVVNPRLQRHYMIFAIGFPGSEALMTIFSTFLKGHLKNFDDALNDEQFAHKLIQASLELHNKVASTFRKTAINFHYEFSIRHLASVFKGLLMSEPTYFTEPAKFASLFIHEAERVYGDRLVTPKNLEDYQKITKDVGKKFFKDLDQSVVFPSPLIFCHCWKDLDEKSYNKIESIDSLSQILNNALASYNETNAAMNLVLFQDAMQHICRVCRILQNGHALMVGVGGSGKQSLTRVAAFICNCSVIQIQLSGTYGMSDLKEDIKQMYFKAGLKGEQIVFMFLDSQIADEKFLVYLNEMLSSGKIPGLFATDEIDTIYNSVRNEGKSEGIPDAKDPMFDFFISKIKKNLHVSLCFSPVGEAFRRRASRFPSLINCAVIDWFQPWPDQALYDVAKRFLNSTELGTPESKEAIVKFMPFSFGKVNTASEEYLFKEKRYNYTTPKSFLELIYLYTNMLAQNRSKLENNIRRLGTGLDKLEATAKDVAVLVEQVKIKSAEVEVAKGKADEVAEIVGAEKAKVEVAAAAANEEAAKTAVIAGNASTMQADCERDLAAAIPAVEKAEAALNNLDKKALQELKSLGKPPGGVSDVTDAILALKGEPKKNRDWKAAQQMMKDVNKFIEDDLKGLKKLIDDSKLLDKNVQDAKLYLALEHVQDLSIMAKKSSAAASLCDFLINIVAYAT
jgi:dynein heavy chain, axonemal